MERSRGGRSREILAYGGDGFDRRSVSRSSGDGAPARAITWRRTQTVAGNYCEHGTAVFWRFGRNAAGGKSRQRAGQASRLGLDSAGKRSCFSRAIVGAKDSGDWEGYGSVVEKSWR